MYIINLPMSIYGLFGIKFISREDIHTYFEINNNDNVKDNIDDVIKILCFYTIAVFETDSIEKNILYKKDGKYLYDTIDNVCEKIYTEKYFNSEYRKYKYKYNFVAPNDNMVRKSENINNFTDYDNISSYGKKYKQICDGYDTIEEMGIGKCTSPVKKIIICNNTYQSNAKIGYYDMDDALELMKRNIRFPFYYHKKTTYYETKEIKLNNGIIIDVYQSDVMCKVCSFGEYLGDVQGNVGAYLTGAPSILATNYDARYSIFDFNQFTINVKKSSDNSYTCTFSEINKLQHAASMLGVNCNVEYDLAHVHDVWQIDEVMIKVSGPNKSNKLEIETIYYGINCL